MAVVFPDATNVLKLILHGTTQGLPYVNTWYAKYTGTKPDGPGLNSIATAMANQYWTVFAPSLHNDTLHVSTDCIDLTDRMSPTGNDTSVHAGSNSSPGVTTVQIACCISWKVNNRYRGGHPRMYLPGCTGADITAGHLWTTTALTRYKAGADAFRNGINGLTTAGLTFQMVSVRYFSNHQLLQVPIVNAVTSTAVHQRVDSMRRRLGKEPA